MSSEHLRWIRIAVDGRSSPPRPAADSSVTVHQDIDVWAARFAPGEQATFRLKPSRRAFVQAARGVVTLNGVKLNAGDGAAASKEEILEIKAVDEAEFLMFDLA